MFPKKKKKMCMQFQARPEEGAGTPGAGLKDGLATWVPGIKTKWESKQNENQSTLAARCSAHNTHEQMTFSQEVKLDD